jgi:hypothetical protein
MRRIIARLAGHPHVALAGEEPFLANGLVIPGIAGISVDRHPCPALADYPGLVRDARALRDILLLAVA